jgi:phosphoglycerate dehydrogenase-like enzyme
LKVAKTIFLSLAYEYFEEDMMAKKKVLFFYPRFVEEYKALLEKEVPEAEFMICTNREEMERYAPEAEIALVGMTFPQDLFKKMVKLEWIQALAAGVESYIQNAEQFKRIPVCRITGAFGKYMAEYVLAYVLYFCQDIPRALKAQREKRWDPFRMEFIHQKTLGGHGPGAHRQGGGPGGQGCRDASGQLGYGPGRCALCRTPVWF